MNTVFPHYETHKEFITFIALMYAPLLRVYAGQLAGSRNLGDKRPILLFLPALLAAVAYFSIAAYTFSHHGKTPRIIKPYNVIVGYAIPLSFLFYSIKAIRLSGSIPYFWKTERILIRLIAVIFLGLFITWAAIPYAALHFVPGIAVKWSLQIIFYTALLVICLAIGWVRLLSFRYINTVIPISSVSNRPGDLSVAFSANEAAPQFLQEKRAVPNDYLVSQTKIVIPENYVEPIDDHRFMSPASSQPAKIFTASPVIDTNLRQDYKRNVDGIIEENTASRKQVLSVEQQRVIAQMVELLMQEHSIFMDSSLTLDNLAARIAVPRHHLSEVLNMHIGKSFYQYLNEYRIYYVAEIMRRQRKDGIVLNILSLAFEAGFHSKSSFNQYFKKVMGCTPSAYLRNNKADDMLHGNN